jgi:hypothetical protein
VLTQHGVFVRDRRWVAADVAEVSVLRHDPECTLLAAAADHDWRTRLLHGPRVVEGVGNVIVRAREAGGPLRHHPVDDLHGFLQHLHACT